MWYHLSEYQRLGLMSSLGSNMNLIVKKERITQARDGLLKSVEDSKKLEILWYRKCVAVSPLQRKID